jgi:hypothetical protein
LRTNTSTPQLNDVDKEIARFFKPEMLQIILRDKDSLRDFASLHSDQYSGGEISTKFQFLLGALFKIGDLEA